MNSDLSRAIDRFRIALVSISVAWLAWWIFRIAYDVYTTLKETPP